MSREKIVRALEEIGVIAVIRMSASEKVLKVAEAIHVGGVSAIEVTMTTPNALKVISELSRQMGEIIHVGVGSVLNPETAQKAIDAGARYVVSPIFKPEIVEKAHMNDVPAFPGAFTPTEIQTAFECGADIVKVFPADVVGMAFFKAIKAPMPHLKIMPTGGVTLTNVADWIRSGACAVGVGGALLDKKAVDNGNYDVLTANAKILRAGVIEGRS